ncbi:hypothetical protein M514_06187 [Trichuris suis]|uniref:Uncharacterized protein n=1 Tax=Trichuris suis TaxID=68888 RepID=A0A085M6N1_9BILA|nr:hypothetical protein M513_06187 [Trichuris suis]KFD68211.1 hypothetical protein M514_06187 [Trichuris suis]
MCHVHEEADDGQEAQDTKVDSLSDELLRERTTKQPKDVESSNVETSILPEEVMEHPRQQTRGSRHSPAQIRRSSSDGMPIRSRSKGAFPI